MAKSIKNAQHIKRAQHAAPKEKSPVLRNALSVSLAAMIASPLSTPALTAFAVEQDGEGDEPIIDEATAASAIQAGSDTILQSIQQATTTEELKVLVDQASALVAAAQAAFDEASAPYTSAKAAQDAAQAEYDSRANAVAQSAADARKAWQDAVNSTNAQKAQLAAVRAQADRELVEAKAHLEGLKKAQQDAEATLSSAQTAYDAALAAANAGGASDSSLSSAKGDVDAAQAALDAAKETLKQASDAHASATSALATAQSELASANQALDAAVTEKANAASALAAAQAKLDDAQAAYDTVASGVSGPALEAAKQEVAAAQAKVDQAKATLSSAESDVSDAKARIAVAEGDVSAANEGVAQAEQAVKDAEQAVAQLTSARDDAKGKLDAANDAVTDAMGDKADADAAVVAAQTALDAAKQEVADAQKALEVASADVATKQAALDALNGEDLTNLATAIGFFESENWTDALAILNAPKDSVAEYTHIGQAADATSIDNVRRAVEIVKRCNELRAAIGLNELLISPYYMAVSMLQTNASATLMGHTSAYVKAENLAWGYNDRDSFNGWYDAEKKVWDDAIASGYYTYNNVQYELDASIRALDVSHGVSNNVLYYTISKVDPIFCSLVGHYLNVINSSYVVTGAAANRYGSYRSTTGQVFNTGRYGDEMTVAEFEAKLTAYLEKVTARDQIVQDAEDALLAAKETEQTATQTVADKQASQSAKQVALADAQAAQTQKQATLDAAKTAQQAAQKAYDDAQAALDADTGVSEAAAALQTAKGQLAAAQAALDALANTTLPNAEQAVENAKAAQASAEADLKAAQAKQDQLASGLTELEAQLEAAKTAQSSAEQRNAAAEAAHTTAADTAAAKQSAVTQAEAALASAQTTKDAAGADVPAKSAALETATKRHADIKGLVDALHSAESTRTSAQTAKDAAASAVSSFDIKPYEDAIPATQSEVDKAQADVDALMAIDMDKAIEAGTIYYASGASAVSESVEVASLRRVAVQAYASYLAQQKATIESLLQKLVTTRTERDAAQATLDQAKADAEAARLAVEATDEYQLALADLAAASHAYNEAQAAYIRALDAQRAAEAQAAAQRRANNGGIGGDLAQTGDEAERALAGAAAVAVGALGVATVARRRQRRLG